MKVREENKQLDFTESHPSSSKSRSAATPAVMNTDDITILFFHYVALIYINDRPPHLQEVSYYLVAICNSDPMEQSSSNGSSDVTSQVNYRFN